MQTDESQILVNQLPEELKLSKYEIDAREDHKLDKGCEWINTILNELIEETQMGQSEDEGKLATLEIELEILRKHNGTYKDHLILTGAIKGSYDTFCIRCLEPMSCSFEHDFAICYIPAHFEKTPEYEDASHIFAQDMELELEFHKKGVVDLKELIHENVFMALERFPLHTDECKGLCQVCGRNLNNDSCNCHTKS